MRRRSWRTWNRCFCYCYDGSMFRQYGTSRRVCNSSRGFKPAGTVECRNNPLFSDSLLPCVAPPPPQMLKCSDSYRNQHDTVDDDYVSFLTWPPGHPFGVLKTTKDNIKRLKNKGSQNVEVRKILFLFRPQISTPRRMQIKY